MPRDQLIDDVLQRDAVQRIARMEGGGWHEWFGQLSFSSVRREKVDYRQNADDSRLSTKAWNPSPKEHILRDDPDQDADCTKQQSLSVFKFADSVEEQGAREHHY